MCWKGKYELGGNNLIVPRKTSKGDKKMKCNNCGKELAENVLFCMQCGAKQEVEAKQEPSIEKIANDIEKIAQKAEVEQVEIQKAEENAKAQIYAPQKKKRKMIKVVGILLIIFGGLSLLGGLSDLSNFWAAQLSVIKMGLPIWYATYLVIANILAGGLMLFSGIFGICNYTKKEKAKIIIVLSILLLSWTPSALIMGIVTGETLVAVIGLFNIILNAVLPILLLIGAIKLKNS